MTKDQFLFILIDLYGYSEMAAIAIWTNGGIRQKGNLTVEQVHTLAQIGIDSGNRDRIERAVREEIARLAGTIRVPPSDLN